MDNGQASAQCLHKCGEWLGWHILCKKVIRRWRQGKLLSASSQEYGLRVRFSVRKDHG